MSTQDSVDPTRSGGGKQGQFVVLTAPSTKCLYSSPRPIRSHPILSCFASCFMLRASCLSSSFFPSFRLRLGLFDFLTLSHLTCADPPAFLSPFSSLIFTDWSLTTLFGRSILHASPVASNSSVSVMLAEHSSIITPYQSVSEDRHAFAACLSAQQCQ
jgi:hypothetical protein